jgi:biotin carboxyl carrier protein
MDRKTGGRTLQKTIGSNLLMSLRAENLSAALSKAIHARENSYYAKYGSIDDIVALMDKFYKWSTPKPPKDHLTKPQRLQQLVDTSQTQHSNLRSAYEAASQPDGQSRSGAVKFTTSKLDSATASKEYDFSLPNGPNQDESEAEGGLYFAPEQEFPEIGVKGGVPVPVAEETIQTVKNYDYAYRDVESENDAQYQRAQISLMDEQFSQFMSTLNLPHLKTVLTNELASIGLDIYRLQTACLKTMLYSPISGVVTGIYKQPGENVGPGETVLRVEDNSTIFLVGTVVYPGSIVASSTHGSTVTVTTQFFDSGTATPSLTGNVVAARGRFDDDSWQIVAKCTNPVDSATGAPLLPLDYHFDYDNTNITITAP